MKAIAKDREWGVKSIKQRRNDEHGNIEFLVEWDGDWMDTWEPQEVLGNAQVAINEYTYVLVRGVTQRASSVAQAKMKSRLHGASKHHYNWPNF